MNCLFQFIYTNILALIFELSIDMRVINTVIFKGFWTIEASFLGFIFRML